MKTLQIITVLVLVIIGQGFAREFVWNDGYGDQDWENPANWQTAIYDAGGAIIGWATATSEPNMVSHPDGLRQDDWVRIRNTNNGWPIIGSTSTAQGASITLESASTAYLTMTGGTLQTRDYFFVGGTSPAQFNMSGGTYSGPGPLVSGWGAGGNGVANISGTAVVSSNITIGENNGSYGVVNLSDSAQLTGQVNVGLLSGSYGVLNVSGGSVGSLFSELTIGGGGKGELNLSGGNIEVMNFRLGYAPNTEGHATVTGGNLTVYTDFWIGHGDNAKCSLTIDGPTANIDAPTALLAIGIRNEVASSTFIIRDGIVNVAGLHISDNGLAKILGGQIILAGDHTAVIQGFIDSGKMISGECSGTIEFSYDGTNTVITAIDVVEKKSVMDFNDDCSVDFLDFAVFAEHWLK